MCYPKALVEGLVRRVPTLEFPVAHVRNKVSPAVHLDSIYCHLVSQAGPSGIPGSWDFKSAKIP